jgi:hypothetical protein
MKRIISTKTTLYDILWSDYINELNKEQEWVYINFAVRNQSTFPLYVNSLFENEDAGFLINAGETMSLICKNPREFWFDPQTATIEIWFLFA